MTPLERRPGWGEATLVLAIAVAGLILRAWSFRAVSLDHFDEGLYAFTGLGLSDPAQPMRVYPSQVFFTPLFPALLAAVFKVVGPSDSAAIATNVLIGSVTVIATWAVGRAWFGPSAGVAASCLLALNDYHIRLSRSALSDPLFALLLLLGIAVLGRAVERRRLSWAFLAGALTALALNTKYHGGLIPLIALVALVGWTWQDYGSFRGLASRVWRTRRRELVVIGAAAAVAAVFCVPWAAEIQGKPGGYTGMGLYLASMLNGLHDGRFFDNAWRQVTQQLFMEGVSSRVSIGAAAAAALLATPRTSLRPRLSWGIPVAMAAGVAFGEAVTLALVAILAVPALRRHHRPYAGWLSLAWLAMWVLLTPVYRPYARLVLPFTIACALVAGFWLDTLISCRGDRSPASPSGNDASKKRVAASAGAAVAVAAIGSLLMPAAGSPWRSGGGARAAAEQLARRIPEGARVIVVGEPTVAFYLHLSGRPAFERTEAAHEIAAVSQPAYVVTGIYARRAPALREGLARLAARLEPLGTVDFQPGAIRLLDDLQVREARRYLRRPDATFELNAFLLRPAHASRDHEGRRP